MYARKDARDKDPIVRDSCLTQDSGLTKQESDIFLAGYSDLHDREWCVGLSRSLFSHKFHWTSHVGDRLELV